MDLSAFTPEQIESLRSQLSTTTYGRSPFKDRQLHDLRLAPTADDPRPTFFWSADPPRNEPPQKPQFARLMWSPDGVEITVHSPKEQAVKEADGYVLTAPANAETPDPADAVREALKAMSPEDRAVCIQAAQATRLAKVQEAMAGLKDADLEAVMASLEPAKRGPGRPRKEDVA
jgi:hypothetical protein